ncbi:MULTISPECIES: HNH/endonuclease VII fold putative polymorphic toxin [Pseudomonas]|jgi:hypothetical protein|uniref:HNH/endonuclease VII fold putative polymorphic toxin n=1 Tax=Pseudomonas TaxID=286 RepID=UPI001240C66F|nr:MULTISPECIES: HNH/endonuclease VII fold putative polymorphic toxin [Pseudomonas]MED7666582.1 hypothetical protein [Pseudomonas moraviensis subsp. stanleyae]
MQMGTDLLPTEINLSPFVPSDKNIATRRAAFREAKRDAKFPNTAVLIRVKRVPLTKEAENGRGTEFVRDAEGNTVMIKEYRYKNIDKERVVIQEHSYGH